jgi:hypothetical protein
MSTLIHGKSEEGRRNRQKILDVLNRSKTPLLVNDLMRLTKTKHRASLNGRLQRMLEIGELSRTGEVINGTTVYSYTANVKTTTESFMSNPYYVPRGEPAPKPGQGTKPTKVKPQGPWHTVHYSENNRPIPNQGGQGLLGHGPRSASIMSEL